MTSHTASCYPTAVQSVRDAIAKDGRGEMKDAYCDYLDCMVFMVKAMRDEAREKNEMSELSLEECSKLFKLTEQCLGRSRDILEANHETQTKPHTHSTNDDDVDNKPPMLQMPTLHLPGLPGSSSTLSPGASSVRNSRRVSEPPNFHYPITKTPSEDIINKLPSPPGTRRARSPTSSNVEMYQALQRRKTISSTKNPNQKYAATNYNLSLFRQAAEKRALNLAKEKIIQQRWLERQEEIKLEAEKRWNLKKNRSQKDKEYRKTLLTEILAFEETVKWPAEYRSALKMHPTDRAVIINIVQWVLKCRDHPLCKVCKGLQYLIYQKVSEVLGPAEDAPNYLSPADTLNRHAVKHTGIETDNMSRENVHDVVEDKQTGDLTSEGQRKSVSQTGSYRPIPAPRKANSFKKPPEGNSLDNNPRESGNVAINDNIKVDNVPKNENEYLDSTISADISSSTLNKADSFEKVYDELGDVMFSSDSEDGDDEAENDSHISNTGHHNNTSVATVNEGGKEHETSTNNNKSTDHSTDGDTDNPLYFALNYKNKNQDAIIPLPGQSSTTQTPIEPVVSISIQSPTSPSLHLDNSGSPLPSRYAEDREVFSDLSDEFEGETYEPLVTTKENATDDKSPYELEEDAEAEHEYFEVDDGSGGKSMGGIEEEVYESLDTVEENIYEDLDSFVKPEIKGGCTIENKVKDELALVIDTYYLKKLDAIVQELRFGIDRLHTVLLLAYDDLDSLHGRDLSYNAMELILFQPLWGWIFQMLKKMNSLKTEYMERVMEHYQSCIPQTLKIREKFTLFDPANANDYRPYQEAIDEINKIGKMISPVDKIDCAVRMSKAIHACVEKYWCDFKGEAKAPTLGCDDLIPIVSFVVLKTNYPNIVSECHAMEEFIPDDYLMGEEGYCLTTLHAAISYLLSLGKDLQTD